MATVGFASEVKTLTVFKTTWRNKVEDTDKNLAARVADFCLDPARELFCRDYSYCCLKLPSLSDKPVTCQTAHQIDRFEGKWYNVAYKILGLVLVPFGLLAFYFFGKNHEICPAPMCQMFEKFVAKKQDKDTRDQILKDFAQFVRAREKHEQSCKCGVSYNFEHSMKTPDTASGPLDFYHFQTTSDPLEFLAAHGDVEGMQRYLEIGTEHAKQLSHPLILMHSPLLIRYAVVKQNTKMLELLLKTFPNSINDGEIRPVDKAAEIGNLAALRLLDKFHAKIDYKVLLCAVLFNQCDVITYLVQERGINVNGNSEDKQWLLSTIYNDNRVKDETIKLLLVLGANPTLKDSNGKTVLELDTNGRIARIQAEIQASK